MAPLTFREPVRQGAVDESEKIREVGHVNPFEVVDDGVIWRGDGESIYVQAWGEHSLRVRSIVMGDFEDSDFSLLPPALAHPTVSLELASQAEAGEKLSVEDGIASSCATVTNGRIVAILSAQTEYVESLEYLVHRCHVEFRNDHGDVLLSEEDMGGSLQRRARHFIPQSGKNHRLTATFAATPGERLFGMGQYQQETFDLKGASLELAHRNSQASVPFVLSSAGYGFLWHNPAIGTATFATNRTIWVADSTRQLDYWITAGDTPAQIAAAYADATGHTPTMPDYGLGYWQCKLRYWNQEQLLEVAREHHRRGIPLDVIVADFFHWPKMGDFRFDPEFWPNPQAMIDELKEMGTELMVSVWPQISHESENFDELKGRNFTVKTERGMDVQMAFQGRSVFADFTNPAAREKIWEICKRNYHDLGVKLFWLDEAEPEYAVYDYDNFRYHQGSVLEIGNIYPQAYARTFFEGQREAGQDDVVNLLRCAWSGSQRFGVLSWSGDIHSTWEALRRQMIAGLHMGVAGIPWYTTDIGGFYGGNIHDPDFQELLIRWFQFGAFCPVMRMHGYREPYEPVVGQDGIARCRSGAENEVWSFGPQIQAILEKYIALRESLRPYLRATMDDVRDHGGPVMRPVFYEFPDDAAAWDVSDQFLLGADLLVAPIVHAGERSRRVYLPSGTSWRSLSDGTRFEGGTTISVEAEISTIPVFARGNALHGIKV